MLYNFFLIRIVVLIHKARYLSVDRRQDINDLFRNAVELSVFDEESFLKADRQIQ